MIQSPYYPIIYLRGYAMREQEIKDTVATPYMGFNLGSTKIRQEWDRSVEEHIFESPLIRLMKDYGYRDIYADGEEIRSGVAAKSVIIYRYYQSADPDLGTGERLSIVESADGLGNLIQSVKKRVCDGDPEKEDSFKVYLVAHSMGGLICRCFLQNDEISDPETKALVDKVFTYGSPHNGIELRGMNVPSFIGLWNINNFNRNEMREYLKISDFSDGAVNSLEEKYDPSRFFCLVGTNHKDYSAAQYAVGPMSDGLVKIKNATVKNAPRAFVYRSHSGHYGLVNSEEGYQNLVRFLFGNVKITGMLEPEQLPLPPSVQKAYEEDKEVRASYYFESSVMLRGANPVKLTERTVDANSAVLRTFDEMFRPEDVGLSHPRIPVLFSLFLDSSKITSGRTMVFTADLAVRTTEYKIDRKLFFDRRIPEEHLYRQKLAIRATIQNNGNWRLRYIPTDEEWGEKRGKLFNEDDQGAYIPLTSKKGFKAKLRLNISSWNVSEQ